MSESPKRSKLRKAEARHSRENASLDTIPGRGSRPTRTPGAEEPTRTAASSMLIVTTAYDHQNSRTTGAEYTLLNGDGIRARLVHIGQHAIVSVDDITSPPARGAFLVGSCECVANQRGRRG